MNENSSFDQLLFDLTDLAIIVVVMFVWSLFVVGFYTVVKTIVVWITDDIRGRRFKRKARRSMRL